MQDLREASRAGSLGSFFSDPPRALDAQNGVIGAALCHDPILVEAVAHEVSLRLGFLPHTVEFSAAVASALAQITRLESESSVEITSESPVIDTSRIFDLWHTLSRRFGRRIHPIVIVLTVAYDFPRGVIASESGLLEDWQGYRVIYRRAKQSRLHFAEPGGRIIPLRSLQIDDRRWGTLGGFFAGAAETLFALAASHVVEDQDEVVGTPAFAAFDGIGVRRFLQRLSASTFFPSLYRREIGRVVHRSNPVLVPPDQCSAQPNALNTDALDIALLQWPATNAGRRGFTSAIRLSEVSETLHACFFGARSGYVPVRITSYSVWHSYRLTEAPSPVACVGDCLQIALQRRPKVWTDVSSPGDSGAWVMADSLEGPRWLGVLIGGDGERSGVVPAGHVSSHINRTFRPDLTPLI